MGIATSALIVGGIAAATATTAAVVGGAIQSGKEHKAMRKARNAKEAAEFKVKELQDARQKIINPYAGVTALSDMASDLTGMMSNPFESLGVATQAAEIQMEEADISLANTLDMLRATGASAGGATALAQAALASKSGVSASIEEQETQNEIRRAQGDAALMQAQVSEQQRLQNIAISEGSREQAAQAQGKIFEFNAKEDRDNADISYNIAKETGGAQREDAARQRRDAATAGIFTGIGNVASGVASSAFSMGMGKPDAGGGAPNLMSRREFKTASQAEGYDFSGKAYRAYKRQNR